MECNITERPLSPVLNATSKVLRKVRRRHALNKLDQLRLDLLKTTGSTQRLHKIKQFLDEKRRLSELFYSETGEFVFKKPLPVKEFCRIAATFCESQPPVEGEKPEQGFLGFEEFEIQEAYESLSQVRETYQELARMVYGVSVTAESLEPTHSGNSFAASKPGLATTVEKISEVATLPLVSHSAQPVLNNTMNMTATDLSSSYCHKEESTRLCVDYKTFSTAASLNLEAVESTVAKTRKSLFPQLPCTKRAVFEEDFSDLGCATFSTATGNQIKVSDASVNTANPAFSELPFDSASAFSTAAGKKIAVSEVAISKAKVAFDNNNANIKADNFNELPASGFAVAKTKKALCSNLPCIFEEDFSDLGCATFSTAVANKIKVSEVAADSAKTSEQKDFCKFSFDSTSGFATAAGRKISVSEVAMSKAKVAFDSDIANAKQNGFGGSPAPPKLPLLDCARFSPAGSNKIPKGNATLLKNAEKASTFFGEDFSDLVGVPEIKPKATGLINGFTTAAGGRVKISDEALHNANRLFEENGKGCDATVSLSGVHSESLKQKNNKENCGEIVTNIGLNVSGVTEIVEEKKTVDGNVTLNSSKTTPQRSRKRLGISHSKPIPISSTTLQKAQQFFKECDTTHNVLYNSTPVKLATCKTWPEFESISPVAKRPRFSSDAPFVLHLQTNAQKCLEDFNASAKEFQKKLQIISQRLAALAEQLQLIKASDESHRRQRPGVLLLLKKQQQRKRLQLLRRGPIQVPQLLQKVTPQNASHVHFNDARFQDEIVVRTADGASIIPNAASLIGLGEIKTGFSAMPGVDPTLIPAKWIENHFKWIVWKLVSYERRLPDCMGCLNVENVVQQLKYRYDREIDNAQRSALRRIIEKDDIPQKRMVLVVSNIFKVDESYELELCDGWYSVRTVIDAPLLAQVKRGRIAIGTKLITQYAELLNCDGCHPLQVTDDVRLKIHCNCTRRAVWYAKLGYQRNPKPFPICLRSVKPDGGVIGCINAYVARVYPLRFMEKQPNGTVVWRNHKAEEKYVQRWENEQAKAMEIIHNSISNDYEDLMRNDDTQGFKNTQEINMRLEQQNKLSVKLDLEIKKLKQSSRDVTAVLKLRLLDHASPSEQSYIFNIWKPRDEHNDLKENSVFTIYNVSPRQNGELTTTSRTYFAKLTATPSLHKLQRRLLPIATLQQPFAKPTFNEFDSVGTVIRKTIAERHQTLWLVDFNGCLLLINVREGSETCSLFDAIEQSHNVAVSNITFCRAGETFAQAIATQCSVVTRYPSQCFLQEGLQKYCEQLPEDLNGLLEESSKKIDVIEETVLANVSHAFNESMEVSTEIPSRLTLLDVAMSLIDTDQYN